jgi:thiosulfate reductase cytochrome b subunit
MIPAMGDSAAVSTSEPVVLVATATSRHSALVRITHWITTLCFIALLVTGFELVISHPRFYWGETGNILTTPLFKIPIPSSRDLVPTGYGYVLPDQNGWSRYLHFQAAWLLVLTAMIYGINGLMSGHFRKDLLPAKAQRSWQVLRSTLSGHLRFKRPTEAESRSYNLLQRISYIGVIFILFPLEIWTGLALSPAFVSAVPAAVNLLGGTQSARTIHFINSLALLLFVLVHVWMVSRSGFRSRMRAMTIGEAETPKVAP